MNFNFASTSLRKIYQSASNLIIQYGTSDSITISNYFGSANNTIERVKFSDGISRMLVLGSAENDRGIFTDGGGVTLNGGSDDKILIGLAGNDSYIINNFNDLVLENANEGWDTVYLMDSYNSYTATAGSNIEVVSAAYQNQAVKLTGSSDLIYLDGSNKNDTLTSGSGQNILNGASGDDIYNINGINTLIGEDSYGNNIININIDNFDVNDSFVGTRIYAEGVKVLTSFIDTGLHGSRLAGAMIGEAQTVKYSFRTTAVDSGFLQFTAAQKTATRLLLQQVASQIGVTFEETSNEASGQITFCRNSLAPGNPAKTIWDFGAYSQANVKLTNTTEFDNIATGSQAYYALLHEVGHALGLDERRGSDNLTDTGMNSDLAIMSQFNEYKDSTVVNAVGHSDGWYASKFGLYDLSALHYLYGVASNYTSTGAVTSNTAYPDNQTYTLQQLYTNKNDHYIADGQGIDTVTAAAETKNVYIDLTPGSWIYSGTKSTDILAAGQAFIGFGTTIENAIGGSGNDTIIGNTANNTLDGGAGNDSLIGNVGNDVLKGGLGSDIMKGGLGNDTYYVDSTTGDNITENLNEGTDSIYSTVNYTLSNNVENGRVIGSANITLTGNTLNNIFYDGSGNDTFDGAAGTDAVSFVYSTAAVNANLAIVPTSTNPSATGFGNDSFINIENLYGSNFDDVLTGNASNNAIYGLDGDDTIDGGTGLDTMAGGLGDDTYVLRNSGDIIVEALGGGTDRVNTHVSYTMAANIEHLQALGATNDIIVGNDLNNTIYDGLGSDTYNGGLGIDSLSFYYEPKVGTSSTGVTLDLTTQTTTRAGATAGTTIVDSFSGFERFYATNLNDIMKGDANANYLYGYAGNDSIYGYAGNDTLIGATGNDYLVGGNQNDTYVFGRGFGQDLVKDTGDLTATDVFSFDSTIAYDQLWFSTIDMGTTLDLVISLIGTTDKVTISSWVTDDAAHTKTSNTIESFVASGKTLIFDKVDELVTAMSAFAPPAAGQINLSPSYQTALAQTIASSWS